MASERLHVILVNRVDNTQRSLIHEAVKAHAPEWWHEFPDVWVTSSTMGTAEWQRLLSPFMAIGGAGLVVLALKERRGDRWATKGTSAGSAWFKEMLSSESPKKL